MKIMALLELAEELGLNLDELVRGVQAGAAGGQPIPPPGEGWSRETRQEFVARSHRLLVERIDAAAGVER